MTFRNSPLAIDGARIDAATVRIEAFANSTSAEGIVSASDLKVRPLAVAGNGIIVGDGNAIIRNRYQSTPNQSYVVSNVGDTTLDSTQMPPANPSSMSHLVCVTVGDPEFSQVGHPWMLATDPPAGTAETFQYVRPWIIQNVPSTAIASPAAALAYVRTLGYPAIPLAGLSIPANTTTITASMIVDLRKVARPRVEEYVFTAASATSDNLNGAGGVAGTYENWPHTAHFDVDVPDWAVVAKVQAYVEGARLTKAGNSVLRVGFSDGGETTVTNINESAPTSGNYDRKGYNVGGEISIPASYRGTTRTIQMQGTALTTADQGSLKSDTNTSTLIRIRFEEKAA